MGRTGHSQYVLLDQTVTANVLHKLPATVAYTACNCSPIVTIIQIPQYPLTLSPVSLYCVGTVKSTVCLKFFHSNKYYHSSVKLTVLLTVFNHLPLLFSFTVLLTVFLYCLTNSKNSHPKNSCRCTVKSNVTTQLFFFSYLNLFGQQAPFLLSKAMYFTEKSIRFTYFFFQCIR